MNHARWRRCVAALIAVSVTPFIFPARSALAAPAPGSVLLATPAVLPSELSSLATGKRISYATTAVNGASLNATGLVLTPKSGKTGKTVAWGHGTTGLADQCSPSINQNVFWPEARAAVAALLAKGWTIAAPDYPGLGTPSAHPYLIGESEARSIIDAVKAARSLDSSLSTQYAIDGHSQGGQGALFAGEIAPAYDGNLVLKGVVSIAPVSNADEFAPLVPGTAGQGYLVMGLFGLQAQDPSVNANALLAPPAKLRTPVLVAGCLNEILSTYQNLTATQLLVNGVLPASVLAKLVHYDNPGQRPPTAPILLIQGEDDEAVPFPFTFDLYEDLAAYGTQPVQFVPVPNANHDQSVFATTTLVANWIAARFS
jgi:pimeloyl-ACP methyl ester carboxylesterase